MDYTSEIADMHVSEFKESFKKDSKGLKVFEVLEDKMWHCRECQYAHVGSTQIAGSGGIQGLERGSNKRAGIKIKSQNNFCRRCNKTTRQDMWTGDFSPQTSSNQLNRKMELKILNYFNYKDIVENTTRSAKELTIDHKFQMIRWTSEYGEIDKHVMNEIAIAKRFQLLKKSNGSASHNLLKSRACENCVKTKKRGTPFGIKFYYEGDEKWDKEVTDENGCHGCGWYDFDKWRKELNKKLN